MTATNSFQSSVAQSFLDSMREADHAQPIRAHTPAGFQEPTAYIRASMVRGVPLSLKTGSLIGAFDSEGRIVRVPAGVPSGSTINLDAAVVANSRVANAGAHVMVRSDDRIAHAVGKTAEIALEDVPVELRNIEAATFGTVDIDLEEESPEISLPVFASNMSWKQATTKSVRFSIPRSVRRRVKPEDLTTEISTALALGLARAADEVLLSAITAQAPVAFSLALAAARGLRVDELRALVGTSAAGASFGEDGKLRAAGVAAEMTPDMAGTLVGSWNRVGVAVNDEVIVHFVNTGLNGHLDVVAWATMLPLVPDPSCFWTAA